MQLYSRVDFCSDLLLKQYEVVGAAGIRGRRAQRRVVMEVALDEDHAAVRHRGVAAVRAVDLQ